MPESIKFDFVSDLYDNYVKVDFDIPFFLNETEGHSEEILELMCGTGRLSIPLLESQRKLIYVDYAQGMLDVFRNKIAGKRFPVELIRMDVTKLNLQRTFKLILLPFHSFLEILTAELQSQALGKISQHLERNGIFICALQNPALRLKAADECMKIYGSFPMSGGKTLILSSMNRVVPGEQNISGFQFYEIYDSSNVMVEKRCLEINFRPVQRKIFEQMTSDAELEVMNIYGDYSYSEFNEEQSNYMIYKLRKK